MKLRSAFIGRRRRLMPVRRRRLPDAVVCQDGVIGRIVIDDVRPRTPTGRYPAKAVIGEAVPVGADVFKDGHDLLAARGALAVAAASPVARTTAWHDRGPADDRWRARSSSLADRSAWRELRQSRRWTDRAGSTLEPRRPGRGAAERACVDVGTARVDASHAGGRPATPRRTATALASRRPAVGRPRAGARRRLVRAVPPLGGRPARRRRTASTRSPTWASTSSTCRRSTRSATPHRKGPNNTLDARPGDPGQPVGHRRPEGGHTAIHPELGTLDDFDDVRRRGRRASAWRSPSTTRSSARPTTPGSRSIPSGSTTGPTARSVRREPAQEVPGHLPDQLLARRDEADREALWDGVQGRSSTSGSATACASSGSTTRTPSRWRSGRGCIPAVQREHPDVLFLAEAFTRPQGDGQAGRGRLQPELHVLHVAHGQGRARPSTSSELATGPWPTTCGPTSGPTRPTSSPARCATGPPAAFELRLVLAATLVPRYGIYSGYELCENEPAVASQRGVPALGEVRGQARATGTRPGRWPRSSPGSTPSAGATRRSQRAAQHPVPPEHERRPILAYSKRTTDGSDVVLVVVNLDPHQRAGGHARPRPRPRSASPSDAPFEAHDELTGTTFTWQRPEPVRAPRPRGRRPAHVLHLRPLR